MTAKAIPIPGRVACERASPRRDCFRRRRKEPMIPAVAPRKAVPRTTSRVLYDSRKRVSIRVSKNPDEAMIWRSATDILKGVSGVFEEIELSAVGFLEVLAREGFLGGAAGDDAHVEEDEPVEVA